MKKSDAHLKMCGIVLKGWEKDFCFGKSLEQSYKILNAGLRSVFLSVKKETSARCDVMDGNRVKALKSFHSE